MISCPPLMETSTTHPRVSLCPVNVRLASRETCSRRIGEGKDLGIRVIRGELWATAEGSTEDHVLAAGDFKQFSGPGLWVAEGIGAGAEFEIA
ncbi:MAG: DUF2917 domain-containing protein [Verrucomicrobiaceae bacterium]|nr:MAG: DUF2917 domain-containing protein [Verrucomicrobiaceae bacterium]